MIALGFVAKEFISEQGRKPSHIFTRRPSRSPSSRRVAPDGSSDITRASDRQLAGRTPHMYGDLRSRWESTPLRRGEDDDWRRWDDVRDQPPYFGACTYLFYTRLSRCPLSRMPLLFTDLHITTSEFGRISFCALYAVLTGCSSVLIVASPVLDKLSRAAHNLWRRIDRLAASKPFALLDPLRLACHSHRETDVASLCLGSCSSLG